MITLDSFLARGEAVSALISDVRSGRAPHAIALTGMAGVGKRTLARLLACAFLCVGEGAKPCMACKGCRRALNGTHPDLLTPSAGEKERSIKVDHLREIIHALSMHAVEGGSRVVLLENAQRMTPQAQNALLKSLEEPDGSTRFILTASGDSGLLPTVRSRCAMLSLSGDTEQQDADSVKLADSFLTAVRTGDRHKVYRWIAKNELSKLDATSAFIEAALTRCCDMLCNRCSAGVLSAEEQMHLYRLLQRCSDHLKVNVNAKHIFSLLAADALPGPSGHSAADTVHKIGEKT